MKVSYFRRDIIWSIGSSGIALFITLISTPIMTRLFPSEAYAVNGMVGTAALLTSTFGLLGLPLALAREQSTLEQVRLLKASSYVTVLLITGCTIVAAIVLLLRIAVLPQGITTTVIVLFPLLVLVNAVNSVYSSLATARGIFSVQAMARIANAAAARGLPLIFGWMSLPTAALIVIGDVTGKFIQAIIIVRSSNLSTDLQLLKRCLHFTLLRDILKDYGSYILTPSIATILPTATLLGVQAIISYRLGLVATGQYVLAYSILTLPVSLIALASAPVVFHRFIQVAEKTPALLFLLTLRVMLSYVLVGFVCMLPLILFGSTIFSIAFGESWQVAGKVAATLAFSQVMAFSLTVSLGLFRVVRRLSTWLVFELTGTVLILGGMLVIPTAADLFSVVFSLAVLMFCYQVLMHVGCLWVAYSFPKKNL